MDAGAIVLTDATTGALDTLRITTSGTKSGDALEFLFTGASTGRGIYLDMDVAVAATGILIDSGGTARTGADIQFTDDSTGTHIVLDINSSGAGASTGFDWTDSYAGSPASFGLKLTMGDSNGLDDTGMLVTRGTGIRTNPVLDIDDASTGSGDMIDIDLTGAFTGDIIDFASSAAATGNVLFANLDNAVAMTGIHLEGSGARTQPMVEITTDCTGSVDLIDIDITTGGTSSGDVIDIGIGAALTGNVIAIDMNLGLASKAIYIDAGNGVRTAPLVDMLIDGTGNEDGFNLDVSNTGTAPVFDMNISGARAGLGFDIDISGAASGNIFDVLAGAVTYTGDVIAIDLGATATGSQALVITSGVMTRTTDLIDINENGAASGDTIDIAIGAVTFTGDILKIDLGATAVGAQALVVTSGVMIRTTDLFDINENGAASGNTVDIEIGAVLYTGNAIDINLGATGTGGQAVVIASGAMLRTTALIAVSDAGTSSGATFDIDHTGITTGIIFDIDATAATTGNVFDYATNSASTGTIFNVSLANAVGAILGNFTLSGTRTADAIVITDSSAGAVDVFQYTGTSTSSGHIFNIDVGNAVFTGNVFDVSFTTAASSGDVFSVVMSTNVAGSLLVATAAGIRTDDLIKIDDSSTGNSHIFDINMSGAYTGNVLDIVFSTAAATGQAISISMDTNVAGMAVDITSAGTGVTGEGSAINITHTGALVAGADIVRISSATGSISSTSNALAVEVSGAGTSGAYAVYINATGTNVEGLYVDAGTVTIDETLTVVGLVTYTGATGISDGTTTLAATMLEANRLLDVSGRLVAAGGTLSATVALHEGKVVLLDTASGSVVTLPAATGTGAIMRFIVSTVPTSNSHIVKVADATDIFYGVVNTCSTTDTPDLGQPWITAADSDTFTMNGTTTGGLTIGDWFEVVDIAANVWAVRGQTTTSGTEAIPFSATVA